MKSFKEFQEEIANVASSGAVAGLGDQPPVSVKGQKAHQKRVQQMSKGATAGRRAFDAKKTGMEGY